MDAPPQDEQVGQEVPPAEENVPATEGEEVPAEGAPAGDEGAPVTDDAAPPPEIKAFIGGLAWEVTDETLGDEFNKYNIISAKVATDRFSGRSRGFGFVVFETEDGRQDAINDLHDKEVWGRRITVAPAVPRDRNGGGRDRRGGGGRGGYRGGGGGRFGGGRDGYRGGGGGYRGGGGGYGDRPPRRYDDDRGGRSYDERPPSRYRDRSPQGRY
ncbi:RNA-binding protein [Chloropicon primus]|uniref:RNA-binding protein n=1 Tax=Chloropicon primus TaxID=1764295 RepID=A0A5B8MWQ1_9CHLO|nr:RNA-binding protein [Chloropicon primus]UPR04172.1 RNA-binding protein [Chloropicon primus]|mmetsp:Transcript_23881/g.51190  ORF Transcript_23881/g.51190 Transcript_23881/m.51190 type:complete len:213 (-) Transcript_23881:498-1136(-)|eukprot:QDZ24963.1 RNA-binding protein [Chloropicon primus]